jgi:transcriptional regulator with XRE-family HTH domain
MNDLAARVAAALQAAAKSQDLSGRELADRIERQTGSRPAEQHVSLWLNGGRPLVRVSEHLAPLCAALGLNAQSLLNAVTAEPVEPWDREDPLRVGHEPAWANPTGDTP